AREELRRRMAAAREQLARYESTAAQRAAAQAELDTARRAQPVIEAIDEAREIVLDARRRETAARESADRPAAALAVSEAADLRLDLLVTEASGAQSDTGESGGDALAGHRSGGPAAATGRVLTPRLRADADLEGAIRAWSERSGSLDTAIVEARSAAKTARDLDALRAEDARLARREQQLTQRLEELPAAIAAAELRSRESGEAKAALPALASECERLRTAASAAAELVRRRGDLDAARVEFENARSAHND